MLQQIYENSLDRSVRFGATTISIAQPQDFTELFQFRHKMFLGPGGGGLDYDEYDDVATHVIVKDTLRGKIVGTYRLLLGSRLRQCGLSFYSSQEFDLSRIGLEPTGDTLELGRSAVDPEYRNGVVIRQLWSFIAKFMVQKQVSQLIGCVSLTGASHGQARMLEKVLKAEGHFDSLVSVMPEFCIDLWDGGEIDPLPIAPPPLMKGYLNLGAKVLGGPAFDAAFNCHDFLMKLDNSKIPPRVLQMLLR